MGADEIPGLLEYSNLPSTIGALVSTGKATLYECETIYSIEDVYLMLEVVLVDAHNRRAADEWHRRNATRG